MDKYYLVAQSLDSKGISIISLNEEWYLGEYGRGSYLNNSLEAIDIFTSQFENKEQLNDFLSDNTSIKNNNADFFIVSVNDDSQLVFDEVIFSSFNSSKNRAKLLKNTGLANMSGLKEEGRDSSVSLLKGFLLLLYSASDFYTMVCDLETNLGQDFVDTFKGIISLEDFSFELDDSHLFAIRDYRTVRNMVEAMNRLEELSLKTRENRDILNQELVFAKATLRESYVNGIKEMLSFSGQSDRMSLLYTLSTTYDKRRISQERYRRENVQRAYRKYKKDYVEENEVVFTPNKKENVGSEEVVSRAIVPVVDDKTKRVKIRKVLDKLPRDVFLHRKNEDKFVFNNDLFQCPVHEADRKQLNTLLKGNMPLFFLKYAISKHEYKYANEMGFNLLEYEQVVRENWATIENKFRSKTSLDNAYRWCMIYDEYSKRNANYTSQGGDKRQVERGKVFEKK